MEEKDFSVKISPALIELLKDKVLTIEVNDGCFCLDVKMNFNEFIKERIAPNVRHKGFDSQWTWGLVKKVMSDMRLIDPYMKPTEFGSYIEGVTGIKEQTVRKGVAASMLPRGDVSMWPAISPQRKAYEVIKRQFEVGIKNEIIPKTVPLIP